MELVPYTLGIDYHLGTLSVDSTDLHRVTNDRKEREASRYWSVRPVKSQLVNSDCKGRRQVSPLIIETVLAKRRSTKG